MITAFERAFDFTSYLLPIQYCRRPIQYPTNQLLTFSIHVKNKIIKNLFLNVEFTLLPLSYHPLHPIYMQK